jgi:hypothetical protein
LQKKTIEKITKWIFDKNYFYATHTDAEAKIKVLEERIGGLR